MDTNICFSSNSALANTVECLFNASYPDFSYPDKSQKNSKKCLLSRQLTIVSQVPAQLFLARTVIL